MTCPVWKSAFMLLEAQDVGQVALVGGWAREVMGLEPPRPHSDVDLVLTDPDVEHLDAWLQTMEEIPAKRSARKRAFILDGVMVEINLLVTRSGDSAV